MGKIEKEKSLAFLNPELAREWHPTKNGELTPYDVTANSDKKVWWSMPYDDSDTGKHYDFEWEASISNRMQGNGCPFLKGKAVWPGYNDLATRNPELAREWHPIKNGELMPQNITMNSGKKVWWFLCYTDPETGKYFEFEWETPVFKRNKGEGCPYLSGVKVWKGYNDLATLRPDLAAEWDYDSNSELTPDMVTVRSNKNIGWICAKGHRWEATVDKRSSGQGCPFCSGKRVIKGETDLATVNPQLAKEWDHDVNGNLTPFDVTVQGQ